MSFQRSAICILAEGGVAPQLSAHDDDDEDDDVAHR
jgi:hypothetical protein